LRWTASIVDTTIIALLEARRARAMNESVLSLSGSPPKAKEKNLGTYFTLMYTAATTAQKQPSHFPHEFARSSTLHHSSSQVILKIFVPALYSITCSHGLEE